MRPMLLQEAQTRTRSGGSAAAILLAGCVVVPLIFNPASDDVFVAPKLAAAAVVTGLAAVLFTLDRGVPRPRRLAWIDAAVVAFLLFNLLAVLFSTDRTQSLLGEPLQHQGFLTLLLYAGAYGVTRLLLTRERHAIAACAAVTIAASAVATFGIVQRLGLDPLWDTLPHGRVFSTIGQANALAAFLAMSFPLTIVLIPRAPVRWRPLLLLAAATTTTALLLTFSRGGYAGWLVAAAIVAIPVATRVRQARPRSVITVVAAGLIVVSSLGAIDSVQSTLAEAGDRVTSGLAIDEPGSSRMHLDKWWVGANIALDHPLVGSGQETYPDLFPMYSQDLLPADRAAAYAYYRVESPHNVYIATAAGAGLPALGAYLVVVVGAGVLVARRIARETSDTRRWVLFGLMAALAAHAVTDFFMTGEVAGSWLFWVLLGVSVNLTTPPKVQFHEPTGAARTPRPALSQGPGSPRTLP